MGKNKRKRWTHDEDNYLITNYSDVPIKDIKKYLLDRSYYAIMNRVAFLGLKRSERYIRSLVTAQMLEAGKRTRFKKGGKSWNKGTKGLTGANKTSFKKRNVPHNWKPIGSERVTKDGYIEIKYKDEYNAKSNYMLKQRFVWESHNGPIPDGYVIVFKDGDIQNFDISNLLMLSKRDNMLRNSLLESTIASRFFKGISSDVVEPLIKIKKGELELNQKIKEYERIREKI